MALADLLFLAMGGEFISVAIFILSGFVTTFFSKNMMVVMCIAMVITNILRYGTNISMQEGLDDGTADGETKDDSGETKDDGDETTHADETKVNAGETKVNAGETKVAAATKVNAGETKVNAVAAKGATAGKDEKPMTPAQMEKFTENMEKLQAYEPLFTSMDKLMEKINGLINP